MLTIEEKKSLAQSEIGPAQVCEIPLDLGAVFFVIRSECCPYVKNPKYGTVTTTASIFGKDYSFVEDFYAIPAKSQLDRYAVNVAYRFLGEAVEAGEWNDDQRDQLKVSNLALKMFRDSLNTQDNEDYDFDPKLPAGDLVCANATTLGSLAILGMVPKTCRKASRVIVTGCAMVSRREIVTPPLGFDITVTPDYFKEYAKLAGAFLYVAKQSIENRF